MSTFDQKPNFNYCQNHIMVLNHRVKVNSLKSGCEFNVKEDVNFKPRKELEITYSDEDSEFQCSWI